MVALPPRRPFAVPQGVWACGWEIGKRVFVSLSFLWGLEVSGPHSAVAPRKLKAKEETKRRKKAMGLGVPRH